MYVFVVLTNLNMCLYYRAPRLESLPGGALSRANSLIRYIELTIICFLFLVMFRAFNQANVMDKYVPDLEKLSLWYGAVVFREKCMPLKLHLRSCLQSEFGKTCLEYLCSLGTQ